MKLIIYKYISSSETLTTVVTQLQRPQTTDITVMKRRQTAATTTASAAEEGTLMDRLRSWVTRWLTNYPIPFL